LMGRESKGSTADSGSGISSRHGTSTPGTHEPSVRVGYTHSHPHLIQFRLWPTEEWESTGHHEKPKAKAQPAAAGRRGGTPTRTDAARRSECGVACSAHNPTCCAYVAVSSCPCQKNRWAGPREGYLPHSMRRSAIATSCLRRPSQGSRRTVAVQIEALDGADTKAAGAVSRVQISTSSPFPCRRYYTADGANIQERACMCGANSSGPDQTILRHGRRAVRAIAGEIAAQHGTIALL
jgi:hypothetical protein